MCVFLFIVGIVCSIGTCIAGYLAWEEFRQYGWDDEDFVTKAGITALMLCLSITLFYFSCSNKMHLKAAENHYNEAKNKVELFCTNNQDTRECKQLYRLLEESKANYVEKLKDYIID